MRRSRAIRASIWSIFAAARTRRACGCGHPAALHHGEVVLDLGQAEPGFLRLLDRAQEPHRVLVVPAVPARRPLRPGQQTAALVVAQRLDVDTRSPRHLASPHTRTLNPYLGTEIKPNPSARVDPDAFRVHLRDGSGLIPIDAGSRRRQPGRCAPPTAT